MGLLLLAEDYVKSIFISSVMKAKHSCHSYPPSHLEIEEKYKLRLYSATGETL